MFIIVATMILIVATMILIVFAKIGIVLKHLKYAWGNCYVISFRFPQAAYKRGCIERVRYTLYYRLKASSLTPQTIISHYSHTPPPPRWQR